MKLEKIYTQEQYDAHYRDGFNDALLVLIIYQQTKNWREAMRSFNHLKRYQPIARNLDKVKDFLNKETQCQDTQKQN